VNEVRLIRRVRFRATHHYGRPEWTDERNRRVFGAQAIPHAHDWMVEVHVVGEVDPETGWVVDLQALDAALARLTRDWDGGDLNAVVPSVAAGEMTPSTENLARWIFGEIEPRVPSSARLAHVEVFESGDLGARYPG